ncbi:MAG: class I SAM-dependent rRNA methyltransferase [Chloroflexi bacterium]|nr:MAG: class I SAM-dependent rRNA methyltransferase [Chloroflexota bacterium]MBL1193614.1 class I SAM-dependent rRNA methyltransferase [Chloroflexota bacterium]NOH10906.1 class I SAM-dependent rRNA methyltransferase [Chloroflexota bacterium]
MTELTLTLKTGREKSLMRRHPWVFSGAIQSLGGELQSGETVRIISSTGEFLGKAAFSPNSQIRARVWTWQEETVDEAFFRRRIETALDTRKEHPGLINTNAMRLIHAESDGLPGLVVDQYGDVLVMQTLSAGIEHWREVIADALLEFSGTKAIYERADADVRELEGLPIRKGWIRDQADLPLTILENDLQFYVDIEAGHKTGFYLDQQANRAVVRSLAAGKEVLDCFAFSGGFTLNALKGGASHVTAVDSSASALDLIQRNLELNTLPDDKVELVQADVFNYLRTLRDSRRQFDMIILDPPKFAPTRAHADKASRGYKDINLLALKLLRPGGLLVTFSCSGGVDADLFQKIVAGAALDAGVNATIERHLSQDVDHPIALNFPEGSYLKGLVCRVASG